MEVKAPNWKEEYLHERDEAAKLRELIATQQQELKDMSGYIKVLERECAGYKAKLKKINSALDTILADWGKKDAAK